LRGKRLNSCSSVKDPSGNILSYENEILSRRRKYFEDLFNPVKATNDDTHEPICFGEEEVFTAMEVVAAIDRLKSGNGTGENEIRPKMLKALNRVRILWLNCVCHVAWKSGKTPKEWQTGVIIPIFKKGN